MLDAVHEAVQPAGALTARRALAAALVRVEVRQPLQAAHRAAGLVHDDDGAGPQHGAGLGNGVIVHCQVHHHVAGNDRGRRTAGDDHLQLAAITHPARQFQQLGKGRAQRNLIVAGTLDVATDRKDLGAAVVGLAGFQEGLAAIADDPGHRREGLGVVDGGGLAVQAEAGREWRLEARLALLAFQRLQQRGFFAADVGAETVVGIQVEREVGPEDAIPQITGSACLRQRLLEALVDAEDLAVNVVVARADAHRVGSDRHALDDDVRVVAQDVAVLEGARLALVRVADEVLLARELPRHETPFQAGGKARATPAPQSGGLHFGDDFLGRHRLLAVCPQQDTLECLIATARLVLLKRPAVGRGQPREDLRVDVPPMEARLLDTGVNLQVPVHGQ